MRSVNALDRELEQWLSAAGDPGACRPSGQRMKAFVLQQASLDLTTKQRKLIDCLLPAAERALATRNALIHGNIQFGTIEEQAYFFVETLEQAQCGVSEKYCLSMTKIDADIAAINALRARLKQFQEQRTALADNI